MTIRHVEVVKDQRIADAWRVEHIVYEDEGTAYITIFLEPDAEKRALAYAKTI